MLTDYVKEDLIIINPQVKSKDDLFDKMVNHLYNHDLVLHKKDFLSALQKREKVSSTEIYPGIALPHARSNYVQKLFVSIVISKKGLDYGNSEMGLVHIAFFFGASERDNKEYLQLLAQSARLLKNEDFFNRVVNSEKPSDVIKLIKKYDISDSSTSERNHYSLKITLYESDKLNDVLTAMVELGITNGTITDNTSLAKKIAYDIPVFAGLSYLGIGKSKHTCTISSIVQEKKIINRLYDLLKENGVDFDKPGVGFMQSAKIEQICGKIEENIEL